MQRKLMALFRPVMVPGSYDKLAGVDSARYHWTDWYLPGQWLPRWLVAGSKRKFADLVWEKERLWRGEGKERLEVLLSGEKMFEGMNGLIEKKYCEKFPDVVTTDGVFSPRSQMVILRRIVPFTTQATEAAESWCSIFPGPSTTLLTGDTPFGIFVSLCKSSTPDTKCVANLDLRPLYDQIAHPNMMIPYVFLVDKDGYIRWRSCWAPTEKEAEMFKRADTWMHEL
eukprot:TRINITY_DN15013_c0_g1_i1.p1 TRINITY_DN15013_c0_g1~~TRINITY_DN15013_c0_g1_i1.p1  ORF type:complete len:242 (+),score=29.55 TRINITY_DN15013_c0_g1_i1:51-728(+)